MTVIETGRLRLRHMGEDDGAFMLALLNSPGFLRYIGDRGVRTVADAQRYVREGPVAAYAQHGYGMYLVERRDDGEPVGVCGLVRRPGLDDVDIGFAFLPEHCARGYGRESAVAVLDYARDSLRLERVVAIVLPGNTPSIRLLQGLGLRHERDVQLPAGTELLHLYAIEWERDRR
jgi:RimJ/RimL family protein N-acetyltransferase